MDFFIKAAQLILALSILVVLHEFGHYIPARIFKTRVEKFYLFFNPWFSIFKKKIGDTEWGIGWLPLGGYVKIAGMVDESMDKEQLAQPAQPWEFRSKPAWQRLIIMIGGVTVNLLLGIFIYICVMFVYGEEQLKPQDLKAGLTVHPYLEKFNIHSGDNIVAIDGQQIKNVNEITNIILLRGGRKLSVVHADGTKEKVILPDGIEYKLFEEGAIPIVSLRSDAVSVSKISTLSKSSDAGINAQDCIIRLDNKNLKDVRINDLKKRKTIDVTVLRDKDTFVLNLNNKNFIKLLKVSPSLEAGLAEGDKFVEIDGKPVYYFDDITSGLYNNKGKHVFAKVLRGKDTLKLNFAVSREGKVGFIHNESRPIDYGNIKTAYYSFGQSIGKGIDRGFHTLSDYSAQLKFLFTKKGASSIGGFGSIGKLFTPTWDWHNFWMMTAFISIILAFMNILPIPALDGGHVVFLLYEIITGREAPQKVLEYAQYVGFILLMGLLLYANGNDIYRWLFA